MKLIATLGKTEKELEVSSILDKVSLTFDDSNDNFEFINFDGEKLFFLLNNKVYDLGVKEIGNGRFTVFYDHKEITVSLEDAKLKELKKYIKFNVDEEAEGQIIAKMPGLVLDVKFAVGDEVQKGDTVLVIESMKMENEIAAPISGKVAKVEVEKGKTVEKGTKMFLIK